MIFEEKNFYNYFEYWSKTLMFFVKNKSAKCQKMHFRAFQRKFSSKVIFFLGKNHVFLRKMRQKFLEFGKDFRQVCQNCILCVRTRFLIGLFFLRKFSSFFRVFGLWGKYSGIFGAKASKGLLELHSTRLKEVFLGNFDFWRKTFYNYFEYWSKTLRTFVENKSAKFQKMLFRAFQRKFFSKIIFFLGKKSCFSTEVEGEGFWNSAFDRFAKLHSMCPK